MMELPCRTCRKWLEHSTERIEDIYECVCQHCGRKTSVPKADFVRIRYLLTFYSDEEIQEHVYGMKRLMLLDHFMHRPDALV